MTAIQQPVGASCRAIFALLRRVPSVGTRRALASDMTRKIILSSVAITTLAAGSILAGSALAESVTTHKKADVMKSSPRQLVDALHTAFGEHHSRAVHAKGIILSGIFIPDTQAATLTRAAHLQSTNSNVLVRFSDFTGIPNIPDNHDAANPRGFAVKFTLPDGASTDIVGHSFDGFPTPNSDQFRELLLAIAASGPGAEQPSGRRLHRYSPICESRSFMVGKVLLGCSFYISFDRRSRCRRGSGSG